MNTGKKFEELFKKSAIEQGYDFTRLKDAGFVGDKSASRRFTSKNICDCILFGWGSLYYLELKSRAKSLRFDEVTQCEALKKKEESLQRSDKTKQADAGVVVYFQQANRAFYYNIMFTDQLMQDTGKKSFNVNDIATLADEHPCFCFELDMFTPKGKRTERVNIEPLFQ